MFKSRRKSRVSLASSRVTFKQRRDGGHNFGVDGNLRRAGTAAPPLPLRKHSKLTLHADAQRGVADALDGVGGARGGTVCVVGRLPALAMSPNDQHIMLGRELF